MIPARRAAVTEPFTICRHKAAVMALFTFWRPAVVATVRYITGTALAAATVWFTNWPVTAAVTMWFINSESRGAAEASYTRWPVRDAVVAERFSI
jgi:hypothetical protein